MEELQEKVAGIQGDLDMAKGAGGVTGNRAPSVSDDSQQSEEILTRLAELEKASQNRSRNAECAAVKPRKPISEFKYIQNVTPLLEDKKQVQGVEH